ncbi:MAG TPA: TraX family protein [Microvirga sp.]|nr:TraX family protein [Microvirga sp.]
MPDTPAARPVTTTDLLKLVALVFVFIDHHGYFFDPANPWWRLFGRVAAPVFFFLIGFARTRRVPWTWLAFGIPLTAVNALEAGNLAGTMVNILINFAILRALVLPAVERHVMARPLAVALLIAGCLPLIPVTDGPLEYGVEGWLWAFLGLAHRLALEEGGRQALWTRRGAAVSGPRRTVWTRNGIAAATMISGPGSALLTRNGIAAATATAYVIREVYDYRFDGLQAAILVALVAALTLALLRFRRAALAPQPPGILAPLFRFAGRWSLEIYAISLFVSHAVAYAIAQAAGLR